MQPSHWHRQHLKVAGMVLVIGWGSRLPLLWTWLWAFWAWWYYFPSIDSPSFSSWAPLVMLALAKSGPRLSSSIILYDDAFAFAGAESWSADGSEKMAPTAYSWMYLNISSEQSVDLELWTTAEQMRQPISMTKCFTARTNPSPHHSYQLPFVVFQRNYLSFDHSSSLQ